MGLGITHILLVSLVGEENTHRRTHALHSIDPKIAKSIFSQDVIVISKRISPETGSLFGSRYHQQFTQAKATRYRN